MKNLLTFLLLTCIQIQCSTDFFKSQEASEYKEALEYAKSGVTKFNQKDYHGALADFNKVIELAPKNATAYYNRGSIKLIIKDGNGACLDLRKAKALGKDEASDLIKKHCGDYAPEPKAEEYSTSRSTAEAEEYNKKGRAKYLQHDYRGAITDHTKAIELDPRYIDAYVNRGFAKVGLSDGNGACLDFRKAKELGDTPSTYDMFCVAPKRATVCHWCNNAINGVPWNNLGTHVYQDERGEYCSRKCVVESENARKRN